MARTSYGDLRLKVEVESFNRALRQMHQKLGETTDMRKIVDFEVGKIVNKAIIKTRKATIKSIKRSQEERPPWRTYDLGKGMKKYNLTYHYPTTVWREIDRRLRESYFRKFKARELARRVWVEILNKLGQGIEASGQARTAESKGFNAAGAAGVQRSSTSGKYGVEIENSYGKNRWVGSAQALFAAVAGRRKYFLTNVAKGVFNDLKAIAAKYPGIDVSY